MVVIILLIVVMCSLVGVFSYITSIRDAGKTENVQSVPLLISEIKYNAFSGEGYLILISQDKSIYYIEFTENRGWIATSDYIIYQENTANNLTIPEITMLFETTDLPNITGNDDYGYIITFSDKSILNNTEYVNLNITLSSSNFLDLNSSYSNTTILDGPSNYITVNWSGNIKTVHEYVSGAPDEFHQIKDVIEDIKNRRWGNEDG